MIEQLTGEIEYKQIFLTSLWIWGIYFAFKPDEIFGELRAWMDNKLPDLILIPIYVCPMCMSSVHSVLLSFYFGFTWNLILIIPMVAGLNFILSRLYPYSE